MTMPHPSLPTAFTDFPSAARAVLAYLRRRLGYDLWMVTRAEGEQSVLLEADGDGYAEYGIRPGMVYDWADSFCTRMVGGLGPRVAADARDFPAYANAPIARKVPIGSYVGVPLAQPDGALFGTLCAINPTPRPAAVAAEQPLVELLAGLLSGLLAADLKAAEATRKAERAAADALRDELTGLYTRRAWDDLLAAEEARCRRFGHPAFAAVLALRSADPAALFNTIRVAEGCAKLTDPIALVAEGELAVLGVQADAVAGERFEQQVRNWANNFGVPLAVAVRPRLPSGGLDRAWAEARAAVAPAPL